MATDSRADGFLLQLSDLSTGQTTTASGHDRLISRHTPAKKTKYFPLTHWHEKLHYTISAEASFIYVEEEEDLRKNQIAEFTSCKGAAVSTWRQAGPFPLLAVL